MNQQYTDPDSPHYMTPGAREAFSAYRRNAVIGFLILLFGLGFVQWQNDKDNATAREDIQEQSVEGDKAIVRSGRAVSVSGCNRDFGTTQRLRALIREGRVEITQLEAEGTLTPAQAERGQKRITKQIKTYPLPDCRKARAVVTANPREPTKVPVPRYPGDKAGRE